ncbi:MAG: helix-turn-helix domain-containing protein [Candidatus Nezhaarchaeales archaeon]
MPIERVLARTIETLHESGFETSKPYVNERSSINVVARSGDTLILIKALNDVSELRGCCTLEIKRAGYALRATPLIVGEKDGPYNIDREVVYERQGVYIIHPDALREYFEGKKHYVYYKGGRFYVRIDGKKLRETREKIGLSLGDLANLVGVSRKAIYEYEKDEIDATIDVASKLYEVLSMYVGEEEALKAFKPVDILSDAAVTEIKKDEEWPITGKSRRWRLQEEVASKLLRLGFSVFRFKDAPFNLIAKKNGERGKVILILTIETLSSRFKEEIEVLRDVAEVAKVGGLVVTRKVLREEGVISTQDLEDITNPAELVETSMLC